MSERPLHSPLGASGAERWMHCPGSVQLLRDLKLPETDEPDYRKQGIAAHDLAARCLQKSGVDAWELIGEEAANGEKFTAEMAEAVQVYLDCVRPVMALAADDTQIMIEFPISAPAIHSDFYGTVDLAVILRGDAFHDEQILDVTDYKHGEGIVVEVEDNPQAMYYAFGLLQVYTEVHRVRLRIVQPRAFHPDGPIRMWETTADAIRAWAKDILVPAMQRAELDLDLDPGPWCRFCPAKLVCPMLTHLFGAAATCNPAEIINLSDAAISRSYQYLKAVDFYTKALKEEALRRLNTGAEIDGIKLVNQRANRIWKIEAPEIFKARFGAKAMTEPELRSPAQMEELGDDAKTLVKQYAYTPSSEANLTVALLADKRPAVKIRPASEIFANAVVNQPPPDDLEIPAFLRREQ